VSATKIELTVGPGQEDNAAFGILLKSLRSEANLSRATASSYTELSAEYIRLMERGLRAPAAGTMRRILAAYKVPCEVRSIDDKYVLIFRDYKVHFTSRIQEGRNHVPENELMANRDKMIGQIFRLMITANDKTLEQIYELLRS
jgi:transcriptional regulator with XRE-family HTH domain